MHMRIVKTGYICKVPREILGNSTLDGNRRGYYLGNTIGSLCIIEELVASITLDTWRADGTRESDLSAQVQHCCGHYYAIKKSEGRRKKSLKPSRYP